MKKPGLAIVIGAGKPKADDDEDAPESGRMEAEKDADSDPHMDASEAILDAVKSGNAEALSAGLKAFYDLCKSEHEEGEGEEY